MAYLPIPVTASATLGDYHQGTTTVINAAAGLTLTLPAASGTGREFDILVGTTVTLNNAIIQVANGTDVMAGSCMMAQDAGDTIVAFETAASSDTITMNGSTKGGILGDRIVLKDVAAGLWSVRMTASGTGAEVTPFSAAVS